MSESYDLNNYKTDWVLSFKQSSDKSYEGFCWYIFKIWGWFKAIFSNTMSLDIKNCLKAHTKNILRSKVKEFCIKYYCQYLVHIARDTYTFVIKKKKPIKVPSRLFTFCRLSKICGCLSLLYIYLYIHRIDITCFLSKNY